MNRITEGIKLRNELSLYQIVQVIEDLYFNEQTFQVSFDRKGKDCKIIFTIQTQGGFKNFHELEEVKKYLGEI